MIINSEILDTYLSKGNIENHENGWLFEYLEKVSGQTLFHPPAYSPEEIDMIRRIAAQIRTEIQSFRPNNVELWDLLFPGWTKMIGGISINLIVGLPPGYDALTLQIAHKSPQIVYDVGNWLAYQNQVIADVTNNLLTHELAAAAGNYYEKFGAMLGMLYLTGRWLEKGNAGVKEAFDGGWQHFASKAITMDGGQIHV